MREERYFYIVDDTGYTFICTVGKPGCMLRHGGPEFGERWLEFKICPKCKDFERGNRVRQLYG